MGAQGRQDWPPRCFSDLGVLRVGVELVDRQGSSGTERRRPKVPSNEELRSRPHDEADEATVGSPRSTDFAPTATTRAVRSTDHDPMSTVSVDVDPW